MHRETPDTVTVPLLYCFLLPQSLTGRVHSSALYFKLLTLCIYLELADSCTLLLAPTVTSPITGIRSTIVKSKVKSELDASS